MKKLVVALAVFGMWGCQTYKYADKVKMISFDDILTKGASMGNIRGEDCQTKILGYATGPAPKLDRAIQSLQNQTPGTDNKSGPGGRAIRYLTDVTTEWDKFDIGLYAKHCLIVKGRGYK